MRARRRFVGAAVLVAAGVVVLPWLFDTAPRPLPADIAIEIPRQDAVAPLSSTPRPAGREASGAVSVEPAPPAAPTAMAKAEPPSASRPEATAVAPAANTPSEARPAEPRPAAERASQAAQVAPADPSAKMAESAKAMAALEDRPKPQAPRASASKPATTQADARKPEPTAESSAKGRFVVQVGAYKEASSARDARAQLEKLGFKTYTQAIEAADGKRIRVRVGPFADRAEADKAAQQIKRAGLGTVVLGL